MYIIYYYYIMFIIHHCLLLFTCLLLYYPKYSRFVQFCQYIFYINEKMLHKYKYKHK